MGKNKDTAEKTRGLVGRLYDELNAINLFSNTTDFIDFISTEKGNEETKENKKSRTLTISNACWAEIAKKDYFTKTLMIDISTVLDKEKDFEIELAKRFKGNDNLKDLLNPRLIDLLMSVDHYGTSNGDTVPYNSELKTQLLSYFQVTKDNYSIERNIYLLIYFAVRKSLPANFYFGYGYRQQLNEFNEKVICRYGVNSKPGTRAIIELAESGNIFALYEHADMLYYGTGADNTPDYERAIVYYQKAAGLSRIDQQIKNKGLCNPLALWSLSYIYFNYHRRVELKEIENISELERLSPEERLEYAIKYAKWAISMTSCAPAENILGVISRSLSENQRTQYSLKSPIDYFNSAKKYDYIYAYNNIASIELDSIFLDPQNAESHLKAYLENLTISAKKMEPYAANTLGKFYLSGKITTKIDDQSYSNTYTNYINPDTAKEYFKLAISAYRDGYSAWAYANLIVHFPEEYKNDIGLLAKYFKQCCNLKKIDPLLFLYKNKDSIEPLGEASITYLEKLISSLNKTVETTKSNVQ